MKTCSFVFLLIIALFVGFSEAKCDKNVLAFENKLASSRGPLEVHCKSANDDLGVHLVNFNAPAYNFSFGDGVILRTKWDCIIRHGPKMEYVLDFIAYIGGFARRCGALYTWIAKDDGVYLSKDGKPELKQYDWTKA